MPDNLTLFSKTMSAFVQQKISAMQRRPTGLKEEQQGKNADPWSASRENTRLFALIVLSYQSKVEGNKAVVFQLFSGRLLCSSTPDLLFLTVGKKFE